MHRRTVTSKRLPIRPNGSGGVAVEVPHFWRMNKVALSRRVIEFAAAEFELASPSLKRPYGIDFGRRPQPLRGCYVSLSRYARLEPRFEWLRQRLQRPSPSPRLRRTGTGLSLLKRLSKVAFGRKDCAHAQGSRIRRGVIRIGCAIASRPAATTKRPMPRGKASESLPAGPHISALAAIQIGNENRQA